MKQKVICVIMGGGRGTRLHPLTKRRCKPAVPLGGKYRLVDIPISNCLNSSYNRIYLLSQFNTASLHRHVQESYKFDPFGGGFVDILSAEQTEVSEGWYQGTADAVRQNLHHFKYEDDDLFLILSGDQLYRMDFRNIVNHHIKLDADITLSSTLIPKSSAHSYGIMRVDENFGIQDFIEKPEDPKLIDSLVIHPNLCSQIGDKCKLDHCLASMGIYVFKASALEFAMQQEGSDFGKEILPGLLNKQKLCNYVFEGYWEDIGTISSFFEANLMLTDTVPHFNFFDIQNLIYTHARYLPSSKINSSTMHRTIISDGCIITDATLNRCVIGIRSVVRENSYLTNVYMMGAEKYEDCISKKCGGIPLGIGQNCRIENAIIDKGARIGNNVTLNPAGKEDGFVRDGVYIKEGILVVCKDAIIPDGTCI